MDVFLVLVSAAELALCSVVAGVLALRWRRSRAHATGSAFGIFAIVALVIAASLVTPDETPSGWGAVWADVLLCVLLAVPYLLVRFTYGLGGLRRGTHRFLAALLVLEVVVTLLVPPLPPEGAPRPGWVSGYIALFVTVWSIQSLAAAIGLWRQGRGQPAVVRHRMRALGTGGLLLALALVLSGAAGAEAAPAVRVTVSLMGLVSIALFAIAFLPPPWLRLIWRQADVSALAAAERGLMTAVTRDDVAATIVPALARAFGSSGAAMLDRDAQPVLSIGLEDAHLERLTGLLDSHPDGARLAQRESGVLATRGEHGWLVVRAGSLAPVFGDDEARMLERAGTLVDLALQRAALFETERASREAAEAASAELETLLYSVSHDLRSPLISVLGYLDVLRQEHGAELTGDGAHYLERISVNSVYMQSLISDLLELSRIGRSDPPAERLDLQAVAEQVVEAARLSHPDASIEVLGALPTALMSDVRARQLLTNLVENALKHGGRADLQVTVSARMDGGHLVVDVADDGRGIPAEYRERVLRVFERLDASRASSGTGMGLAICKRIVETLGGRLTVGGPQDGVASGTTVSVQLPAEVLQEQLVPGPREPRPAARERTTAREMS